MKRLLWIFLLLAACTGTQEPKTEADRWQARAERVTIMRDDYGVPHIYGPTDADAVFGMLYAQCEDDFNRVEMNFINAMGRLAEVEGEGEIFRDLRMNLYIDPEEIKALYAESPEYLKELMQGWADGINYYLHTHPEVQPKLLSRVEPWMALTFSEGSIGGDIEPGISTRALEAFYTTQSKNLALAEAKIPAWEEEPRGSNGISIAPQLTENGHALFLINPHTSFFFRSELHVVSDEGLNAYGATTWGQLFVYQGFNDKLGWMHTSTYADVLDEYAETIVEREGQLYYLHGKEEKPLRTKQITVPYRDSTGTMAQRTFTAYYTHHGPVVRAEGDKWITMALMHRPVDALRQSFDRTKAQNYAEFMDVMRIRTNSSNNTVYADAEGNIAYFHGNYLMKRDDSFDWSEPVDGSNPATDYQGMHTLEEMLIIKNPENGWLQNCNSTPFTAAGEFSPEPSNYPHYMAPDPENYRGIHAVQVLQGQQGWTLDKLRDAAYDPYMPGFAHMLPGLITAYDESATPEYRNAMSEVVEQLRTWDYTWSQESVETSVATFWALEMMRQFYAMDERPAASVYDYIAEGSTHDMRLTALQVAVAVLDMDFGTWQTPWGDINRYQRITGDIQQDFNDDQPSLPVAFASGRWGSLASFGARKYPGTKRMYGTSGNSFVAFVEFGEQVKAMSISTGGGSGDPASPHFDDQALMYTQGQFKPVHYYRQAVEAAAQKTYHPGE